MATNANSKVSKVLVLYTGGTIGMVRDQAGHLVPQPQALEQWLRENTSLNNVNHFRERRESSMQLNRELISMHLNSEINNDVNSNLNKELNSEINSDVNSDLNYQVTWEMNKDINREMNKDMNRKMEKEVNNEMHKDENREINKDVNREMNKDGNREMNKDVNREMNKDVYREMNKDVNSDQNNEVNGGLNEEFNGALNKEVKGALNKEVYVELDREIDRELNKEANKAMNKEVNWELNKEVNVELNIALNREVNEELKKEVNGKLNKEVNDKLNKEGNKELNKTTDWLVLFHPPTNTWIHYKVIEYSPLLDSSNMTAADRIRIVHDIADHYAAAAGYDGFVVLHGTDTLVLTGSYVSFMLPAAGLDKPVILTGSQVPIYEGEKSDGVANMRGAIILAGTAVAADIGGGGKGGGRSVVGIFFDGRLLQANRTIKRSCVAFDAFESPNWPALAILEGNDVVNLNPRAIRWPNDEEILTNNDVQVQTVLSDKVVFVTIFPDITGDFMRSALAGMKGAVIAGYGAGNLPSNNADLLAALAEAAAKDVILVRVTQCRHGAASADYETAAAAEAAGMICGGDMTWEAAYAKLSVILAMEGLTSRERRQAMETSIRGEMTIV